ncbi:MmgE/PrpD family protein [Xanthobacter dioxanivorans]|uniref:MmgE/PrpD family protein n=1 Tax=Xanthobacter dioxanivorans TaxID=2528964 RepID=A0A974PNW3_9HYPH|nr:MmgE/PrpD family protein [Xanthobacter dioxanivorans]
MKSAQGITQQLAEFAASIRYGDLPPEVPQRAHDLTIDFIGNIVRAGAEANSTPSLLGVVWRLGLDGPGQSAVFGLNRRYPPATAALINGMLGHSLHFNDTHSESSTHPSAPVMPAALAAAEMPGASGRDLLVALVAGYEVMLRVANALDPTVHYARGFHPTATAGVFGATAGAGRIVRLAAAMNGLIAASLAREDFVGASESFLPSACQKRHTQLDTT